MKKIATAVRFSYKFLLRVIISASLMIWLLSKVDINEIASHWREINWILLVFLIPIIYLMNTSLRTLRLGTVLSSQGLRVPFWYLGVIQLRGSFLRSFLPGGIAADIYNTYAIAKKTENSSHAILSVLVDRAIGVASMLFLSLASLLYGMYWLGHPVFKELTQPVLFASVVFLGATIILALTVRTSLVDRIQLSFRFWKKLQEIMRQIPTFFSKRSDLLKLALLSFLLQLSIVTWYFIVSKAGNFNLSLLAFMATTPLIELLLTMPISIGGIGVREGVFVLIFTAFGLTVADAVSFSLLIALTAMMTKVLSGIAFLFEFDQMAGPSEKHAKSASKVL